MAIILYTLKNFNQKKQSVIFRNSMSLIVIKGSGHMTIFFKSQQNSKIVPVDFTGYLGQKVALNHEPIKDIYSSAHF